ncbi:c-type cytochrome [Sphingosinicella sp.]|uniref:c-type cytochrome n=1 Tax=Sphingosinicella sp. TaxID=1917971 RepID=UPI004037B550
MIAALLVVAMLAVQPATAPESEGARLFRRCVACHSLAPGRNSPAGPTLHNIVGRAVAGEADFRYSPALQAFARRQPHWTEQALDGFLADPLAVIPGTDMGFQGIDDPGQRQTLIRWLARPDTRID